MVTRYESDVQGSIIDSVKEWGWMYLKMNPGKWGIPKGFPDLQIFIPGGAPCFIEVKRPGVETTKRMQSVWHRRLRAMGYACYVVNNHGHAVRILKGLYEREAERRRDAG